MYIEHDYQKIKVPQEIIKFCDHFTYDAKPEDLRFIDCLHMNLGHYGNDPKQLKEMRQRIIPIFE